MCVCERKRERGRWRGRHVILVRDGEEDMSFYFIIDYIKCFCCFYCYWSVQHISFHYVITYLSKWLTVESRN